MNQTEFWILIDECRGEAKWDGERQVELIRARLRKMRAEEIVAFERMFRTLYAYSYTEELCEEAGEVATAYDDGFDYFRCWLVAQGEKVFRQVVEDPTCLGDLVLELPGSGGYDLESLMYVAREVYREKFGAPLYKDEYEERGPLWLLRLALFLERTRFLGWLAKLVRLLYQGCSWIGARLRVRSHVPLDGVLTDDEAASYPFQEYAWLLGESQSSNAS